MPKLESGRLSGLYGMEPRTFAELHAWADRLEAQTNANGAGSSDDPAWLRRWAAKMRRLAAGKEKAWAHKTAHRRGRR
jgi:hypothetical protein